MGAIDVGYPSGRRAGHYNRSSRYIVGTELGGQYIANARAFTLRAIIRSSVALSAPRQFTINLALVGLREVAD
jgi:hypothetical protein